MKDDLWEKGVEMGIGIGMIRNGHFVDYYGWMRKRYVRHVRHVRHVR